MIKLARRVTTLAAGAKSTLLHPRDIRGMFGVCLFQFNAVLNSIYPGFFPWHGSHPFPFDPLSVSPAACLGPSSSHLLHRPRFSSPHVPSASSTYFASASLLIRMNIGLIENNMVLLREIPFILMLWTPTVREKSFALKFGQFSQAPLFRELLSSFSLPRCNKRKG
jgi:hypothetical protein